MLRDLKVIELAGVLAGPAAGLFFAELGANVIKVENPRTGGDITRQWKLQTEDPKSETSAYFASVNWNKQHLFLDYTLEKDLQKTYALISVADILICNWKSGDALKFKLDYTTIKKINPEIIYANISGFGEGDNRVAYDAVLQAETGWMFMNGTPESLPQKIPVAIIDLFAAHQLKEGILTAYIQKLKTGKGAFVSISLYDAAVASLANQAANYLNTGFFPQRSGSLHPNIAPYGEIITCADGNEIVLAIGTDKQFSELCQIINCSYLMLDDRFSTNANRVKNRTLLFQLIKDLFHTFNSNELLDACKEKNIPVGLIRNLEQVFENQAAQNLVLEDGIGKRVRSVVFKIDPEPGS